MENSWVGFTKNELGERGILNGPGIVHGKPFNSEKFILLEQGNFKNNQI
jgi:hypothetical protein